MSVKIVVALIFIIISLLLQLIAYVTPGWHVLEYSDPATGTKFLEHDGLFYGVICKQNKDEGCDTSSWSDYIREAYDQFEKVNDSYNVRVYEREYNYLIKSQVEAVLAFVLTIVTVVLTILLRREGYHQLTMAVVNFTFATVIFLLILEQVSYNLVVVKFLDAHNENGDNLFNYSLLILGIAGLASWIAMMFLILDISSLRVFRAYSVNSLNYVAQRHNDRVNTISSVPQPTMPTKTYLVYPSNPRALPIEAGTSFENPFPGTKI